MNHLPTLLLKSHTDLGHFAGYASVFGVVDSGGDVVVKGAFEASLRRGMPKLFAHHQRDQVPGRIVKAVEDSVGLLVEGQLNLETQLGRETRAALVAADLDGLSIGARVIDYETKGDTRILTALDVVEVSIVSLPANDAARIFATKSAGTRPATVREYERSLRDLGFSKREAAALSKSFTTLDPALADDTSDELAAVSKALSTVLQSF